MALESVSPDSTLSIPHPYTSFVGRDREIQRLLELARDPEVHIVTLTGPGGVGKSRLAIEVANAASEDFRDGAKFVPLASEIDPRFVVPALAKSLGIVDDGALPVRDQVVASLRDTHMLLVVDNFEHVSDAAVEFGEILAVCSQVSALVTSRAPLRLSGEWEFAIGPLDLPKEVSPVPLEESLVVPSIQLFVQRASAARKDVQFDHTNVELVAEICRRVDGLPLAIELATTQVKFLPLKAILGRLETQLPIPSRGIRDLPARQQTMHDAINWSFKLLTVGQRRLFVRLGVFAREFSPEAAQSVNSAIGNSLDDDIFDQLAALVDQSLMQPVTSKTAGPRYSMLQPIRDFARGILEASGELQMCRDAHARHFLSAIEHYQPYFGSHAVQWAKEVEEDSANYVEALEWLIVSGQKELALRMAIGLDYLLWSPYRRFRDLRHWMKLVLDLPGEGPRALVADAQVRLSATEISLADPVEAKSMAKSALTNAVISGNEKARAWALVLLGGLMAADQQYEEAATMLEEGIATSRTTEDSLNLLVALNHAGLVAAASGDFDRARNYLEESITMADSVGHDQGVLDARDSIALLLREQGEMSGAAELGLKVLDDVLRLNTGPYSLAVSFLDAANYAVSLEQFEEAARLSGIADELFHSAGHSKIHLVDGEAIDRQIEIARSSLGEDRFNAQRDAGKEMPLEQALELAERILIERSQRTDKSYSDEKASFGLTPRELDVLRLVAQGNSNRTIAESLFISVPTVKVHVRSIMAKLYADSRTAAAAFAIQHDLT